MADEDDAQRTEEPTSRRLSRAHEEGQYPSSSEATGAAVVLGAVAMLVYMGGGVVQPDRPRFLSGIEL